MDLPRNRTTRARFTRSWHTALLVPLLSIAPVFYEGRSSAVPAGGATPAAGSTQKSLAELSTKELARLRIRLLNEAATAGGSQAAFAIHGQIQQRLDTVIYLFGSALPLQANPSAPGSHLQDACLAVKNPTVNGEFLFDRYVSEEKYYAGETTVRNAFGVLVPCSVYGDLPERTKSAVAAVSRRVSAVDEELKRRTVAERQLFAKLSARIDEIDRRISKIPEERSAALSARTSGTEGLNAALGVSDSLAKEQAKLEAEKRDLTAQRKVVDDRLNAIWEGDDVPSLGEFTKQSQDDIEARRRERDRAEAVGLQAEIDKERNEIRRLRDDLAAETRVHDGNVADARRSGSDTSGEMAYFRERTTRFETAIRERQKRLDDLEARLRVGSSDDQGTRSAPADGASRAAREPVAVTDGAPVPTRPRTPADLAWENGDWADAFELLSKDAEAGDAEAGTRIGVLFYEGLGRPSDMRLAEEWFRKSADKGSAAAKYRLGLLYSDGRKGAPWDLTVAHGYLRAASESNADAALKLAHFYWNGVGVAEDRAVARGLYQRAARLGSREAAEWLRENP